MIKINGKLIYSFFFFYGKLLNETPIFIFRLTEVFSQKNLKSFYFWLQIFKLKNKKLERKK